MTFEEASRLCAIAWGPQPMSDGQQELCFRGRIARARHIIATSSDPDKRHNLQRGIDILTTMKIEAENAAIAATVAWATKNLDRQSTEAYPPKCQCEGCQIADAQDAATEALADARQHFHNLVVPAEDRVPIQPLLFSGKGKDAEAEIKAWAMALQVYAKAKAHLGEPVNWKTVHNSGKEEHV